VAILRGKHQRCPAKLCFETEKETPTRTNHAQKEAKKEKDHS
jgi:hypothetical protein